MANTLKIKRGVWNTTGAPSSLAYGEIAWDNASEVLYIGKQTDAGGTVAVTSLNTVVINDIPVASSSTAGLAKFTTDNFSVDGNGLVIIKDLGIATAEIQDDAITTAKIADNAVTLGTQTTGNYVGTITGGTGIDSTGATSGEGIAHSLSLNLNELGVETTIAQDDFVAMVDATDSGSQKITFSNLEDSIFGNVTGDISIAAGGTASIGTGVIVTADIADDQVTADKLAHDLTLPGDITISGNLTVQGDTTTLNTSNLIVEDKKVVIADGVTTSAGADTSGIYIGSDTSPVESITYSDTGTKWVLSTNTSVTGTLAVSSTSTFTGAITASGGFTNTTFDGGTY
jgi:hypothetical protein